MISPIHFMFIGAHPDDADIKAAGTAIKFLTAGNKVTFVSLTNGDAGHHEIGGKELATRRKGESEAVAKFLGIEYIVLDNHDAELLPTIENRHEVIKLIREQKPDIIVTHRPNDYHADHRNTSLLVQDAAYLLMVPNVCSEVEALKQMPVILYHHDDFSKPTRFSPDVIVDITNEFDKKIESLALHESQVFEWLPWIKGVLNQVPVDKTERIEWLKSRYANPANVNQHLPLLKSNLTEAEFKQSKYIEAFEICEYGGKLNNENFAEIFPFGIKNF